MKTRIVLLFDLGLIVAGVLPVLYFVALLAWQVSALFQAGLFLDRLHIGLVFALVGLAVMALGALGALRQMALIRARKRRNEDRLRRVRDYRSEDSRADALDGRREPFIGSGGIARNADRRIA